MKSTFLPHAFSALLLLGHAAVALAQNSGERKVRIEITRNENGQQSHVTREFDLSDEQQLADALKELGVMDEINLIGNGENLVIDMRRMRDGGMLNDMCVGLSMPEEWEVVGEPRAYLGVFYGTWGEDCEVKDKKNKPPVKKGACITAIDGDTPAQKAGLETGDVIVAMDGKEIGSGSELVDAIDEHKPGDQVKVTFYRGKEKKTTEVTLSAREEEAPDAKWYWKEDGEDPAEWEKEMEAWAYAFGDAQEEAFLGVDGESLDNGKGVRLTEVVDSSAAEQMGLKVGDVVRSFNGTNIISFEALAELIGETEPDQDIQVMVERGDKEITFSGKMGRHKEVGVWNWNGRGFTPMAPMAPMSPMPPMPPMPRVRGYEMSPEEVEEYQEDLQEYQQDIAEHERDMAEYARDRDEQRREMDQLRREMDRLRRDLRGDVTREMRVTINAVTLSKEETDVLKGKGVTGLDNALDLPGLNAYPNPSKGSFNISFTVPERGDLNVDVHDAAGERVYHETITGFKGSYERVLDMSDRSDGTYFLVISQNGKTQARKLVKQ